jgi:hypothetical protein
VAAKKGTKIAAMAVSGDQPFIRSLSFLTGGLVQNGPKSVKGAPLLGAAKRTLDGEDRSEMIADEGKAGRIFGEKWYRDFGTLAHRL